MQTCIIVAIGDELLLGDQLDTNSQWLSTQCRELGVHVIEHVAASDKHASLRAVIQRAVRQADIVLTCGGLGPTSDDRTRFVAAEVAGVPLERNAQAEQLLRERFRERARAMQETNVIQADIPAGATIIPAAGTASGFVVDVTSHDALVACLPGPPWELRAMFNAGVRPLLDQRAGGMTIHTETVQLSGIGESDAAALLRDVEQSLAMPQNSDIDLSYLASAGVVRVRLTVVGERDSVAARLAPIVQRIEMALGDHVVGRGDVTLEQSVVQLLREQHSSIVTAESATAGGVAATIASQPGASDVLRAGYVVYQSAAKVDLLDLSAEFIQTHGPVSSEVTARLAAAAASKNAESWALAITGEAGPESSTAHPVGTVFVAATSPAAATSEATAWFKGDRAYLQRRFTQFALEHLRQQLR